MTEVKFSSTNHRYCLLICIYFYSFTYNEKQFLTYFFDYEICPFLNSASRLFCTYTVSTQCTLHDIFLIYITRTLNRCIVRPVKRDWAVLSKDTPLVNSM